MIRVREAIVVEGRYDKAAMASVVDAVILETSGFGIFSDREKLGLLRRLAEARGLVVLTDSDGGGFLIRRFLRESIDPALVKHAYIPDIPGKERRKRRPGKEGKLGVEGMSAETLLAALRRAGATIEGEDAPRTEHERLTKADLYALGLSGRADSAARRAALLRRLDLPERLTANALLEVLNVLITREELEALRAEAKEKETVFDDCGNGLGMVK